MKILALAALGAAFLVSGCETNKVVFVTSTSIGINLDTTPGTVSLAYDRTEGYAAPSYKSGTLPPVMASIQTDGAVIAPHIRQVYATGAAARLAAGGSATEPSGLTHRLGRLAFVGTTTTLGVKVAFTGVTPESLNIGYKRKEFSYIPLGCQDLTPTGCLGDSEAADLYPSVIGSYDTSIALPSAPQTSLRTLQFVATGTAAEALAPHLVPEFLSLAKDAVAFKAGQDEAVAHVGRIETVVAYVAPGGTVDTAKLKALVDTANATKAGAVGAGIAGSTTAAQLRAAIGADDGAAKALAAAIPQGGSA